MWCYGMCITLRVNLCGGERGGVCYEGKERKGGGRSSHIAPRCISLSLQKEKAKKAKQAKKRKAKDGKSEKAKKKEEQERKKEEKKRKKEQEKRRVKILGDW